MIEKEKLQKIKESKFYLAINNIKTNEIYGNNIFLNDFNKEITKKSINNRLNTKIFLRKTVMLIKRKEKITDITINQQNKFKKKEMSPLSETSKLKMMYTYIKALNNNKIELLKYNDTEISMKTIKFSRIKIKCNIHNILKDYIFSTIDFGEVVLSNPNKHNKKKDFKKQGSFIHNIKMKNNIISLKRKNSFHPTKKIYINHDLEDAFSLKKTSNNIKKDIKIKHNPANLITIQDCILKSLPYYKEKYMKDKEQFLKKGNTKKYNKKKSKFYYKSISRHLSKKFLPKNSLAINSSNMILKVFKKKNTVSLSNERILNKKLLKKDSTTFNLEDFTKNLTRQLSHKSSDSNIENYSILKRKNFFKKTRFTKDKLNSLKMSKHDIKRNDSIDSIIIKSRQDTEKENEKDDINEEQVNYEEIYFELIQFIVDGKNKSFEKFYEKNRNYIEINQEIFDGNTLLILCAQEGNYYITKFLCEEKADVNMVNNNGNTALHYAIGKQFYAIADILTRYGAREDIKNIKGLTPWECIEHNID